MNEVSTSLLLGARDPEKAPLTYWISDGVGGQALGSAAATAVACFLLMTLQIISIARALVVQPKVLLLDEPLSNLDAKLRVEMREELKRLRGS